MLGGVVSGLNTIADKTASSANAVVNKVKETEIYKKTEETASSAYNKTKTVTLDTASKVKSKLDETGVTAVANEAAN